MFKVRDKVFDIMRQKWGVVERIDDSIYPIKVRLKEDEGLCTYTSDGRVLVNHIIPSLIFREFYLPEGWQERPRWRAEKGSHYWHIDSDGQLFTHKEEHDDTDDKFFRVGNYFSTREEAMESELYKAYKR